MMEECSDSGRPSRRGLFKKKATSTSITSGVRKAPSVTSIFDDHVDVRMQIF